MNFPVTKIIVFVLMCASISGAGDGDAGGANPNVLICRKFGQNS